MKTERKKLTKILNSVNYVLLKIEEFEARYAEDIKQVHPRFKHSARNLVHYMAMRDGDIQSWYNESRDLGLPTFTTAEAHVLDSLSAGKAILHHLLDKAPVERPKGALRAKKAVELLNRNTRVQFGDESNGRATRIMVTMPLQAADEPDYVRKLFKAGMNCARINCSHDGPEVWARIVANLRKAANDEGVEIKIMMDLGGPKLRTGPMEDGPKVVRIRPVLDDIGRVASPARVRFVSGAGPLHRSAAGEETRVPVGSEFLQHLEVGTSVRFEDARGKQRRVKIARVSEEGAYGFCDQSAYLRTGMALAAESSDGQLQATGAVGDLPPKAQALLLRVGDQLRLDRDPLPGANASYDQDGNLEDPAHISCALPEVFNDVRAGEPICFNDGKIEGRIVHVEDDHLMVEITQALDSGARLRGETGINLPESDLTVTGLTEKDRKDLAFVAGHADTVSYSFVNTAEDVDLLREELSKYERPVGIILKIETRKGFRNLPRLLLRSMQTYPVGVMIARGDLAVECGWENLSAIQEEILRICEAAHVPSVWATQVLQDLSRKGTPSRSEVTDAAQAQRSECVMLNKGAYIEKAIRLLDHILRHMQRYQDGKRSIRPALKHADRLELDHL